MPSRVEDRGGGGRAGSAARVLVVEDEEAVAGAVARWIRRERHDVDPGLARAAECAFVGAVGIAS